MLEITKNLKLRLSELKFSFISSPGPGGQNVNKVATAVLLRFKVLESSLPESIKIRLANRLSAHGELLIKASTYRTQERNKKEAIERLVQLIKQASFVPKKRKKTKPTRASKQRRLKTKKLQGTKKALRRQGGLGE